MSEGYGNNFNNYKEQSLQTMTNGELLLLVFDELVKRMKRAKLCIERDQDKVFIESIDKSREIVTYLIRTLDHKYPISDELNRLYVFFNQELAYISSSKSVQRIDTLLPMIEDMRETWKQAQIISKSNKSSK